MAEFYIDHGAYGTVSNRIGLDTPTWGVPQEGDGYSTNVAIAAGVAEIQILAAPTASESLLIAGATITAAVTAGVNQFARGVLTTDTATNIVTLINSANFTATVSTSVVAATTFAPNANQGRNLFYARVKPGATDTVQIMWLIGSVALNHTTNSAVAISSASWASVPTVVQFIGGTSGCWGWLLNPTAIGQGGSIAAASYGVLFSRPTVVRVSSTSNTVPGLVDIIWLRTGSGQTISLNISGNITGVSREITLIADTNTKWTGDSGTGVVEVRLTNTTAFILAVYPFGLTNKTRLCALGQSGLKFYLSTPNSAGTLSLSPGTFADVWVDNILFEEDPSATAGVSLLGMSGSGGGTANLSSRHTRCTFNHLRPSSVGRIFSSTGANGGYFRTASYNNCDFNFNYTGITAPSAPLISLVANSLNLQCSVTNSRINGLGAFTQPVYISSTLAASTLYELIAENVRGSRVDVNGVAPWFNPVAGVSSNIRRVFVSNPDLGGSWRLETGSGAADWVLGAGFPTLAGLSPGNVPNSVRMFWLPAPTGQSATRGFIVPFRQQSRGTTGTKTITLELLVPSSITFDYFNVRLVFTFITEAGALVSVIKTGADLVSSASSWTNAGSYPGHVAKKLTFTTSQQIAQYADVSLDVGLFGDCPAGTLQYLFVDPGYSIT